MQGHQKNLSSRLIDGIQVHIKDPLPKNVDAEKVVKSIARKLPEHILELVDILYIGQFDFLEEKQVNAVYMDGAIYTTNDQADNIDMLDDVFHEYAHAIEKNYNVQIYSDNTIESEFMSKRSKLEALLDYEGYDVEQYNFSNPEYDINFDIFLHNEVGYEKIRNLDQGMFLNSYSITSLSEYFATSFEEYYLRDRRIVKKITPAVFLKIDSIHRGEIEYDHQA
tara:strand:- start:915 stop:1583 length:669 start_codon:yes stop_codon:yes gene_type:complete